MKKIAILIPVFNHIAFTKKCIQGLHDLISDSTFENCEYHIVVIDDGSSDGTAEWLEEHHPEVHVLKGNGSLWWSGGINRGADFSISELKVDFLLLWNNDIIPARDYFIQLAELLTIIDNQTVAGSKILYYNQDRNDIIWSLGGFFNPKSGKKSMLGYNMPDSDEFSNPADVDWLPGMGTLVPVSVVEKIGFWDEKVFPQYHGDSDFTFRAKTAGYRVISYPQLRIWNDKSSSGLTHGGTFHGLIKALTSRRANANFKDNFRFYRRHSTSILAYKVLFGFYLNLIGGFFKWKFLSLFGIKKHF